jgi:hypothetical protein
VSGNIKITEPNGREWELDLELGKVYSIGRAKDNDIVLNDRRASRKHAQIAGDAQGFRIIDGSYENGALVRSVNHVFVNGAPALEKNLVSGDVIVIGESRLQYSEDFPSTVNVAALPHLPDTIPTDERQAPTVIGEQKIVDYDDKPLGTHAGRDLGERDHRTAIASLDGDRRRDSRRNKRPPTKGRHPRTSL